MNFNKILSLAFLLLVAALGSTEMKAQDAIDHSYKPLKLNLNEDGSKYIRFIMWHQIWATTNNLSADNDPRTQLNVAMRRSRFLAFAQVSPRFMILTHWGLNSLSAANMTSLGSNGDSPQLFLHDAWGEFKVSNGLHIGAGLHYWKGMTRLSNQSTLNMMTLDQARPFVHWHSLGVTDQFARHMGVYAKGQIGKFDYRIAFNNPIRNNLNAGASYGVNATDVAYVGASTADADGKPKGNMVIEGYARYQFWDKESTKLPYAVGTYLGKKKVLGIGAGFFMHPNGMYNAADAEHANVSHVAVDAFMDLPTATGALTAYASFMNFNYGENYVARWAGTGTNLYFHAGYFIKSAKLMPYISYQTGNYEGLEDQPSSLNIGVNRFILGHNAKLTLEYHSIKNQISGAGDASQIRLQAHIFL